MATKFKKGDRVRCVDAERMALLSLGQVYDVLRVTDEYVFIDGPDGGFWHSRFELIGSWEGTVAPENRSRVDAGPSWGVR
jgi:hypothetical protein